MNVPNLLRSLPPRKAYFDPDDLDTLKLALNAALAELTCDGSPLVDGDALAVTRIRLAVAILNLAKAGESEPGYLAETACDQIR